MNPDHECRNDDDEEVLFDGDTKQFDARSEWNGKDTDG